MRQTSTRNAAHLSQRPVPQIYFIKYITEAQENVQIKSALMCFIAELIANSAV